MLPAVETVAKVAVALVLSLLPAAHDVHLPGHRWPVRQAQEAPQPTATPSTSSYTGGVLSEAQVASYARAAGFPEALVPTMVQIAYRESNFCPRAVNGYGCVGPFTEGGPACSLWQLYPCPGPEAADPMAAAWLAREKCLAAEAAGKGCLAPWGG